MVPAIDDQANPETTRRDSSTLESRTAGNKIIRGGTLRAAGYIISTGLTALAYALLLRHLGLVQFGRFSTVVALVTIAGGLAEAGLQMTGQRLYTHVDAQGKRRLLQNLVGIRLILTPIAVLACAAFGIAAGYGSTLIYGTLIAGMGAVLVATAGTLILPLSMELRYGALTSVEVGRQLVLIGAFVAMVEAGASLIWFFFAYAISGIAMVLFAVALVDRRYIAPPRVRWSEWRPILVTAGPLALSLAINVFYLKILIVMASLLTGPREVGLFATASRITEVLVGLPTFMVGAAFPLLAHAGANDEPRLTYAMQRVGEVALLVAGLFVVVLVVAAEPIIALFAGPGYEAAAGVLRIQAFALLGASMAQAWVFGVIAVGAQRSLIAVNLIALASVAALGAGLIPLLGAEGASIAAVCGETVLAGMMLVALVRARPALRPGFGGVPKLAAALVGALLCTFLPVPAVFAAVAAVAVYLTVAWALGVIPAEVAQAFMRRGSGPASAEA